MKRSRHSQATTRTKTGRSRSLPRLATPLLSADQVLRSAETGVRYRVGRMLGFGGFGQVFLARPLGAPAGLPDSLCVKISAHMDGWVREAYFGQLLENHPRAIRVYDRFTLAIGDDRPLYGLALEYAKHGDLSAFLRQTEKPWPERTARREIAGLLEVLGKLHRGEVLHRDLTPMNVFVCEGRKLKLGDFGIARAASDRRVLRTRTLNPAMAPSEIVLGLVPKWQARDDVYQVGQLLGMLVKGNASVRIRTGEIRRLACSDQLKEIVHRCIGERRKRYESAAALIEALNKAPARLRSGVLRSLDGVHLAFTGILSRPRVEAARAAKRAGAIVHGGPSVQTTVLVRGRANPLQAAGQHGGIKLMEIKRLREKGHKIVLLNEARFWDLAAKARKKRRSRRG